MMLSDVRVEEEEEEDAVLVENGEGEEEEVAVVSLLEGVDSIRRADASTSEGEEIAAGYGSSAMWNCHARRSWISPSSRQRLRMLRRAR